MMKPNRRNKDQPDVELEELSLVDHGRRIGSFRDTPIFEWLQLSDGRMVEYFGTIRDGECFEMTDDIVILDHALMYRATGETRMSLADMKALAARGAALDRHRDQLTNLAINRYSDLGKRCKPAGTMIVPHSQAGAWVPVWLQAPTQDPARAVAISADLYDREDAIQVQGNESPLVDESGTVWVPALLYLNPEEIQAGLGTCIF